MTVLCLVAQVPFGFTLFLSGAFINAIPAIILHFAVVPPAVLVLKKPIFCSTFK